MSVVKLQGAAGASAEIHEHGAHVTSWRTDGVERLFLSERAEFRPGAAIRGGVPVIFPQFAGWGPLPKHGFARVSHWQRVPQAAQAADTAVFRLRDDAATHAIWPHRFAADYSITLSHHALRLELSVSNRGTEPFAFTAALHTYLRVSDIAGTRVQGLQGLRYIDSAAGGVQATQVEPELHIEAEVDRIYFSALRPIRVIESGRSTMTCSAHGFTDAVIWNPGREKAAQLSDLEPDGFRRMLCVEAAVVGAPVELQPRASWSGVQLLQLERQ